MESNALVAEFVPPHSQTKFLLIDNSGESTEFPATTRLQKELNHTDKNNEPVTGSDQLHHIQHMINQLKMMGSLYKETNSHLNIEGSSSDKLVVVHRQQPQQPKSPPANSNNTGASTKEANALGHPIQPTKMKACRAPSSRKFGHPCNCDYKNHHKAAGHHSSNNINQINTNTTTSHHTQPPSSPLYLYDPLSRKCLPTSRHRDMLLRDCLPQQIPSNSIVSQNQNSPSQLLKQQPPAASASSACIYDDLRCDPRRLKCVCKQSLHLYYESNWSSFGCVPLNLTATPDGVSCRKDQIYNVISKECQKIFDINDLPPSYMSGLSANQFPFVTLALIWVLLLIVILTAKLRKIRTTTTHQHRHSSSMNMRNNRAHQRQYSYYGPPTLVHSIMAAFHGHQHLDHGRRRGSLESQYDPASRNYDDTDFFLNGETRRDRNSREMFVGEGGFTESQQSLNNPPPKFEDIYPSCPLEPPPPPRLSNPPIAPIARPQSADNLPSYDEAMKLQNTKPPDVKE